MNDTMEKLNTKENVVIYGDSDFAEQVYHQLESDGRYEVLAFTVDEQKYAQKNYLGHPVYPFQKLDHFFQKNDIKIFVAIGYSKMNAIREAVFHEVSNAGYEFLTYTSKYAVIDKTVNIGDGSYIGVFVSIGSKTIIGKGVIVLPNTRIEHNVAINNFCYLSSAIAVGGFTVIKNNSFIGLNATIKDNITIAEKNIIGAASNVTGPTAPNGIYVGNPAKRIKDVDFDNFKI
jgi:sugar O-acyltransferase (sialic acid O-acetyltransferase NeuD family)